jgi:hypothetical protein
MREMTGDALERRVAQSLAPALLTGTPTAAKHDDEPVVPWRRVAIAEGVELHVREDSIAAHDDAIVAMREALRTVLGRSATQ